MAATKKKLAGDVKDMKLCRERQAADWCGPISQCTVLQIIRKRFLKERPLEGVRISACLHVTTETANLAITLRDGGADVGALCFQPVEHSGRCGGFAGEGLRDSHLRH